MDVIPQLLTQYLQHHPDEAGRLEQLTQLVAATHAPADLITRTNFMGHVTASGFVLSADRSTVLLIHHRRLAMYVQPGGHLDPHDASPLDGARREVREETGLDRLTDIPVFEHPLIPFDIDSHYIPPSARKNEPAHWHHDFRYLLLCPLDTTLALALDEVAEAKWVPLTELGSYPSLETVAEKLRMLVPASIL